MSESKSIASDATPTRYSGFDDQYNSGIGCSGGDWIIHEFTRDHWITVRRAPASFPF